MCPLMTQGGHLGALLAIISRKSLPAVWAVEKSPKFSARPCRYRCDPIRVAERRRGTGD